MVKAPAEPPVKPDAEPDASTQTGEPDGAKPQKTPRADKSPKEVGGREGLDPTRYGDWEKAGRCIDF